jgi:hypothetical protein
MLSFKQFLLERQRPLPLVIIDIQPEYDSFASKILNSFISFLNNHRGAIYCFFNDEDFGATEDDRFSVSQYYMEAGADPEIVEHIKWRPKYYAFFRDWMDLGMDRKHLIMAIRHMVMNRINDSQEIEDWEEVFGSEWNEDLQKIVKGGTVHIPSIDIAELKSLGGCYLVGGHRDECLSEFRLLLETFNIPYKLISSLVYY